MMSARTAASCCPLCLITACHTPPAVLARRRQIANTHSSVQTQVVVETVMPGMWDCHCHLLGTRVPSLDELARLPVATAAARCTADLRAALDAGFTSVREVGGLGVELASAVNDGSILGPTIYAAGALLSPTGGHADLHSLPHGCVAALGGDGGCDGRFLGITCDGVPECLRAVRLQVRRNAQVIKVCASGGVLTEVHMLGAGGAAGRCGIAEREGSRVFVEFCSCQHPSG